MPSLSHQYKHAIVTGCSRGLGEAFARMLIAEGVEVWGTARDPDSIFVHDRMHPCALDLGDDLSIANFLTHILERCPSVDLLINNAGYGVFSPFETFPVNAMTHQINVLLTGPIRLCRAFYPGMKKRGQGTIVNVASLAAEFPLPMMPLYNASKAGLSRFTRTLEIESSGSGVTVIDFQPGDYRTGFNDAVTQDRATTDPAQQQAWAALEKHLQAAPAPEHAAQVLRRALLRRRSGVVSSGSVFQARIAPLAARCVSWRIVCGMIRRYYGI